MVYSPVTQFLRINTHYQTFLGDSDAHRNDTTNEMACVMFEICCESPESRQMIHMTAITTEE